MQFSLVFPRESLSVPVMRHVLGDILLGLGADDDGVADLLLAVTEACTNVLQHAGPDTRRYRVSARVGAGGCLVEVLGSDRGSGECDRGLDEPAGGSRGVPSPAGHDDSRIRRSLWLPVPPVARIRRRADGVAGGRPHRWAVRSGNAPGSGRHGPKAGRAPWTPPVGVTVDPPGPSGPGPWMVRADWDELIDALPETGRGLAIMRACVDDVTLSSGPGRGTVVSLSKRIAWRSDAPVTRRPAGLRDAG